MEVRPMTSAAGGAGASFRSASGAVRSSGSSSAVLPLLAPPSGDTLKFRHRNNDLDELEEEALRVQIRQHIGASARSSKLAKVQQERYRDARSTSEAGSESASLTGGIDVLPPLSAMWASSTSLLSVSEILKLVQRVLWFSDEDMAEEIDDSDPKIQAGKKFLAGVEAFAMLTDNELGQLVALAEFRAYSGGETVVEDERRADGLYIVMTGSAARYPTTNGVIDGGAPTDVFGYQDHFGVLVSPTEAMSTERSETVVVATAELVECIWLPEFVVRVLNIQPRLEHEFALILHNARARSDELLASQSDVVRRLLRAGLHVTVMANTRNTTHTIVLLLSAPLWLLAREDKLMAMERIIANHAEEDSRSVGDDYEYHGETMTASERLAAFASVLTRSARDKPPGVGLRGLDDENLDAVVRDVFPLHDPSMTDVILSSSFHNTHTASTKRLFLLRIKDYFGLRIAFFTAFVRLYTAALAYPRNVGALLWLSWRWVHYRSYTKALGVYGLCVACIWAPSFLKRWQRYQNSLLVEWNLLGTKDVAQPNPAFRDYVVETINVAGDGEPPDYVEVKTYDQRRRWPKYAIFTVLCALCLVLLFVFVGVYVQWYIVAVMTPMCTDPRCPAFLDTGTCVTHCESLFAEGKTFLFMKRITSCASYCDVATFDRNYYRCNAPLVGCFDTERGVVGTARWLYVFVQGVVLGLTLDVVFLALFEATALAFNRWENYATEQERETRCIEKIFLFNWVGYFYWFFLLAFVYVPNGDNVQRLLQVHVDRNPLLSLGYTVRFSRYWVDGLISMDAAFVTPMIVTQALNLVVNTFVPYLLRQALVRARDSYHVKRERFSSALKLGKSRAKRIGTNIGGDTNTIPNDTTEASLDASAFGDYSVFSETDRWFQLAAEPADRSDASRLLAERDPVVAKDLDAAVRELFRSASSHDAHMLEICAGLTRDDLDAYQVTSYDWLDRVARSLADTGSSLRAIDQSDPTKSLRLQFVTQWQCRSYNYTADRVLEEASMPTYSPFGDLLHLAIQFSYTIMFSVVWPFCCLCAFARNAVALRFDMIKMTIDCKRPVPRRTVGIGPWLGAFVFEVAAAQVVVPALFVYVSGQFDAFASDCEVSVERYGPAPHCRSASERLAAFCALENVGIAVCLLVYWKKSAISNETRIKVVAHSRKLRHSLRKSVRMIGETVLVSSYGPVARKPSVLPQQQQQKQLTNAATDTDTNTDPTALFTVDLGVGTNSDTADSRTASTLHNQSHRRRQRAIGSIGPDRWSSSAAMLDHCTSSEWREGTVAWVKNGRVKVNFSGGRALGDAASSSSATTSDEVWLTANERHVLLEPTPVKIFDVGMPVLLASKKFGRWLEATVTSVDTTDRFGRIVAPAPNEMHLRLVEAQNLRSLSLHRASAAAALIDPYCVVTVGAYFRHATNVKRRAVNPVWDERVEFPLLEKELYGTTDTIETNTSGTSHTSIRSTTETSTTTTGTAKNRSSFLDRRTSTESRLGSHGGSVNGGDRSCHASFSANGSSASHEHLRDSSQRFRDAAVGPLQSSSNHNQHVRARGTSGTGGGIGAAPLRTIKVAVFNNDPFAMNECLGEVELDLNQLRDGRKRRLLVPLSHKRHIWTLEAVHALMRKQALGAADYPVLGMPHLLLELQWIDTRLPTKVAVRVRGQPLQHELVLSRKFCETGLCYGISAEQVVAPGAAGRSAL